MNGFFTSRIDQSTLFDARNMLYEYQDDTIKKIDELMKYSFNFKGQVILPTGAGKTKIMEYLIGYFISKATGSLCFATFCHRLMLSNNLLAREINAYVNTFGMKKLAVVTLHSSDMKKFITKLNKDNKINVKLIIEGETIDNFIHYENDTDVEFYEFKDLTKGGIEQVLKDADCDGRDVMFAILYHSMKKLLEINFKVNFNFAFYDEAHTTTTNAWFNMMNDITKLSNINLFFTATPSADSAEFSMQNEKIYGPRIIEKLPKELVDNKFITPIKLYIMDLINTNDELMEYEENKRYVYHQLNAIMTVFQSHTKKIHKDSNNKREPILFVSVSGNKILDEIINPISPVGRAFKSFRINESIDLYTTSAEKKGYIDYFEDDDHDLHDLSKDDFLNHLNEEVLGKRKTIIIQIDQLNEGIDLPGINGVLNLRSNGSNPAKFLQFIGRSIRRDDADRKLICDNSVKWFEEKKFFKPCSYVYMPTNTTDETERNMQMKILENLYNNYGDILFKSTYVEKMNGTAIPFIENPDLSENEDENKKPYKNVNVKRAIEYLINLINMDYLDLEFKRGKIREYFIKLGKNSEEFEKEKDYCNTMSGIEEVYKYLITKGAI